MKVRVEEKRCSAYGNRAEHYREVFKLDEFGFAYVENEGLVAEGLEEAAALAVAERPSGALSGEG
jgi:ferredoxin